MVLLSLNSCTKEPHNQLPGNTTTNSPTDVNNRMYFKNGKLIQKETIDFSNENQTLVYTENNTVLVFDNDNELSDWAVKENTDFSKELLSSLNKLNKVKSFISTNNIEQLYEQTGEVPTIYTNFYTNLTSSVSRPSATNVLIDSPDGNVLGGAFYWSGSIPLLGSFNNRTSAVQNLISATWLCDGKWFGGAKAYFGGVTTLHTYIWFDNRASSVIAF